MADLERFAGPALLGAIRVIGCIPRKAGIRIGNVIGRLLFTFDKKHREIAINNISRAYNLQPQTEEVKRIARRVFNNLGNMLFEIAWAARLSPDVFMKHFGICGADHYLRAMEKGKGVLLLTAHMGNWELFPVIAHMAGIPAHVVYRPLDSRPLDEAVKQIRCRFGAQMIPSKRALFKTVRALRKNECVVMLMDQNVDWYNGVYVDFFGRRACTNKGMAVIALRTGAPVVPVFMIREGCGFRAEVFPEIPLTRTGDNQKDVELNTEKYNKAIETIVRQYPDQWFWVHQRWKTRPYCAWPRES